MIGSVVLGVVIERPGEQFVTVNSHMGELPLPEWKANVSKYESSMVGGGGVG